ECTRERSHSERAESSALSECLRYTGRVVLMPQDLDSPNALAWAELQRRGDINPRYLKDLENEISAELARCFEPVIHEQDIRPYGAIVAREPPNLEQLGRLLPTDGLRDEVIHSLADGRQTLTVIVKGHRPLLLLLTEPIDTEQD